MLKYIVMSLLLCVCAPAVAQIKSDGYEFKGNPPILRSEFTTVIVQHDSLDSLNKAAKKYYGTRSRQVHAFNIYNLDKNICTIHIIKPAKDYMPEHIGHELVHCIYGNWHK